MKESDIRPKAVFEEYLRLSAQDAAEFFPDAGRFAERACPACAHGEASGVFTKAGFPYARCTRCDTLFARRVPPAAQLQAFYRDSPSSRYWAEVFFPAVVENRRPLIFAPRAQKVLEICRQYCEPASLIDVGAGAGIMLEEAHRELPRLRCRAVEPGAKLADSCRSKGFETFEGFSDEACQDHAWARSADAVTSFEVLEHLDDVVGFVRSSAQLVRPGGLMIMSGLSGDGFDIRVLGPRSKAVSPPHHITFLTRRGAGQVCERAGIELVSFTTPGKLDVDIVRNAVEQDSDAVTDPFLRHLLCHTSEECRGAFQEFLASSALSSHMWLVARVPG